jgi:hypothetical protein
MSPEVSNKIAALVVVSAIILLWVGVAVNVIYVLLKAAVG